jgi:hypothetical protein
VISALFKTSDGVLATDFEEDFKVYMKQLVPLIPIGLEDHWP